jgi:diguanylate cyclase (GGDEF)-like protein
MQPSFKYKKFLPQLLALLVCAFWIVGLSIVDFSVKNLSLLIFYIVPVYLAAWYGGKKTGIAISFVCAAASNIAEIISIAPSAHPIIPYWNLVISFCGFLIISLLLSKLKKTLLQANDLARSDPLTGVANRRAFFEIAGIELYRMNRYKRPFSVAYLELDDFKNLNVTLGTGTCKNLLRSVVEVLDANVRSSDLLARIGDDKFAILFTETNEDQAKSVIEKLCASLNVAVKKEKWETSYSIGVVTCIRPPSTVEEILKKADHMMHAAKREGKNRVQYLVWRESAVVR